jgi:hypothetical protein
MSTTPNHDYLIPELGRGGPGSKCGKLSNTSSLRNPDRGSRSGGSLRNGQSLEIAEERSVLFAGERVAGGGSTLEEVDLAGPAESGAALFVGVGIRRTEESATVVCNNGVNIVENVALKDTAGSGLTALEHVALDVEPDVVDGVEESLAAESGATASSLGDVVVLHGDGVAGADHLEDPVVVAIAASGVVGGAVDEVAGEGDASARFETKDIVLATGTSGLSRR